MAARPCSPGPEREAADLPGPGAYDITDSPPGSPRGPAYSMRARPPEPRPPASPGPGAHDPQLPGGGGPAFSLGTRPADPGAYAILHSACPWSAPPLKRLGCMLA